MTEQELLKKISSDNLNKTFHKLSNIERLITGFARIVYYEVHSFNRQLKKFDPLYNPHFNKIILLEEGKFDKNELYGFGRVINYET